MTLDARFAVRRPTHTTSVDLQVPAGQVLGLIGPNGAGKSTTLRALAGLVAVDDGHIRVDGRSWSEPGSHLPASRRSVGLVFQDSLLFPHLSALDNVAFGLRTRGSSRSEARAGARTWLERLEVADLAARRPRQLSGGQAQRVALARALAPEPAVLLLDEPTAALDAAGAMTLRVQLRRHLSAFGGVSLVVTHTALDAMVLADRLAVLDDGVVVQIGTPAEVAAAPRTQHVAALVGLNLVRGRASSGTLEVAGGHHVVAADRINGDAFAVFSPAAVSLFTEPLNGSPRNVWPGTVASLAPHGDAIRVRVEGAVPLLADVTPAALASLCLEPGSPVWASVKATEISVYPA